MQHLSRQWRNAAASSGVKFVLLDHTDPETAAEHLRGHGVTAAAAEPNEWGRSVMHALTTTGGFSFHDHVGDAPDHGFMVSLSKSGEQVLPVRDVTGAVVADYAALHAAELADPMNYLGGWVYKGKVYLDVSRLFLDKEEALAQARTHNQIGIYDIGEGKTIITATGQYEASVTSLTDKRPAYAVRTSQSYDDFAAQLRRMGGIE